MWVWFWKRERVWKCPLLMTGRDHHTVSNVGLTQVMTNSGELCRRQGVPKVKVQYHGNSLSWCLPPRSVFVSLHFLLKKKILLFYVFGLRWRYFMCLLFFFFSYFSLVTLFGGEIHGTHNCLTLFNKRKGTRKKERKDRESCWVEEEYLCLVPLFHYGRWPDIGPIFFLYAVHVYFIIGREDHCSRTRWHAVFVLYRPIG